MDNNKKGFIETVKSLLKGEEFTDITKVEVPVIEVELEEEVTEVPSEGEAPVFIEHKAKSGEIMRITKLEKGEAIIMISENGEEELPDGEYEIEELNIKLVVVNSVIDEVVELEVEEENEVEESVAEEIPTELSEDESLKVLEDLLKMLTEDFKSIKESNEELTARFNKFAGEPAEKTVVKKIDFKKQSREDKLKFFSK